MRPARRSTLLAPKFYKNPPNGGFFVAEFKAKGREPAGLRGEPCVQHGEVLCSHQSFIKIHRMVDFLLRNLKQRGENPQGDKKHPPFGGCFIFSKMRIRNDVRIFPRAVCDLRLHDDARRDVPGICGRILRRDELTLML